MARISPPQAEISYPISIVDGGTGSTTQNFVDLTTNQTVNGIKDFAVAITLSGNTLVDGPSIQDSADGVLIAGGVTSGFRINDQVNHRELFHVNNADGRTGIGYLNSGVLLAAQLGVTLNAATVVGQIIQGAASQTADLQDWRNSAGTPIVRLSAGGILGLSLIQDVTLGGGGITLGPATLGFFGHAPANQPAAITSVVNTASALSSYGYTQAQADSIPVAINFILAALQSIGLIA